MRKLLTFLIALAAVALVNVSAPAHAFGCNGWPQISGGNGCNSSIAGGGGGGAFTGPCDLITCAAAFGLRAPSAATRGNRLIQVCDAADAHCGDLLSDATTGHITNFVMTGGSGVNCSSVACTIKTYYDILAANNCSAASCDVTQATIASRHTFGTSCATVTVCATSTGGFYTSANALAMTAAPVFFSAVTNVAASTSQQIFIGNSGGIQSLFSWNVGGAGHNGMTCDGTGTNQAGAVGSGGYFATAGLCNAASSYVAVGSSVNSTVTLGFASQTTFVVYGGQSGNSIQAGGIIQEGQINVGSTIASATATTLTANAKTFWGF
jgi:hypothetical protein